MTDLIKALSETLESAQKRFEEFDDRIHVLESTKKQMFVANPDFIENDLIQLRDSTSSDLGSLFKLTAQLAKEISSLRKSFHALVDDLNKERNTQLNLQYRIEELERKRRWWQL